MHIFMALTRLIFMSDDEQCEQNEQKNNDKNGYCQDRSENHCP